MGWSAGAPSRPADIQAAAKLLCRGRVTMSAATPPPPSATGGQRDGEIDGVGLAAVVGGLEGWFLSIVSGGSGNASVEYRAATWDM